MQYPPLSGVSYSRRYNCGYITSCKISELKMLTPNKQLRLSLVNLHRDTSRAVYYRPRSRCTSKTTPSAASIASPAPVLLRLVSERMSFINTNNRTDSRKQTYVIINGSPLPTLFEKLFSINEHYIDIYRRELLIPLFSLNVS